MKPTGWPRCAPKSTGSVDNASKRPTACVITARPLHGGVWRSYADHRMATAGAIVGLRVPGVEVEDIGTTAKTLPEFPQMWADMLAGQARTGGAEPSRVRRVRCPGPTRAGARARGPRLGPTTPTHSEPWWSPSTAAGGDACWAATPIAA